MTIQEAIGKVIGGKDLDRAEMTEAMNLIMSGECTPAQIGGFLVGLRIKGETVEEIAGAATVMREKATAIACDAPVIVDTCGTGGDGAGTFNISTTVAFVAAGAGITVAKHGNRAVSSQSGSADVLKALGANLELTPERVSAILNEVGIAFLFAPALHGAMKHAIGPRRELGQRTIFNLLGPLTNPAGARHQLLGVFDRKWVRPVAETLHALGSERALVVHGSDGLDEITLTGVTHAALLADGRVADVEIDPAGMGISLCPPEELSGSDPETNARIVRDILEGREKGARRDIVALNGAAVLFVAGKADSIEDGYEQAEGIMNCGKAADVLERFLAATNA